MTTKAKKIVIILAISSILLILSSVILFLKISTNKKNHIPNKSKIMIDNNTKNMENTIPIPSKTARQPGIEQKRPNEF